jgi:hypothetical protein
MSFCVVALSTITTSGHQVLAMFRPLAHQPCADEGDLIPGLAHIPQPFAAFLWPDATINCDERIPLTKPCKLNIPQKE